MFMILFQRLKSILVLNPWKYMESQTPIVEQVGGGRWNVKIQEVM